MIQKKIIGIAGAFGSGKSTAADILQDLGYQKISLGKFLEEELVQRGEKKITRRKLQDLGNEWRERYGNKVLITKALELAERKNWDRVVIDGYRNIDEFLALRKQKNVLFVSLVANRKTRYDRLKKRDEREHLTPEFFEELDNRDLGIGEKKHGLHTALCIAMADIFIENNGTKKDLETRIKKVMHEYE